MSSEKSFNHNKSTRKTRKKIKANPNKQQNKRETTKGEGKFHKIKLPKPIMYEPNQNITTNMQLVVENDDDKNNKYSQGQERIIRDAGEIVNYYLELHKNMINTYNSVYSQILQNKVDLSYDLFFNSAEKMMEYSFDIKDFYLNLISNRDKSLKLIDDIITENLDTFIKSIKLVQKFYKDVMESYVDCIKNYNKFSNTFLN